MTKLILEFRNFAKASKNIHTILTKIIKIKLYTIVK